MKIMNYEIFTEELESLNLEKRQIINTINAHSYIVAKDDLEFKNSLLNSDILIPDGSGIVLAAKVLNKKIIKKISGYDLHSFLLKEMNQKSGKIFYMGSSKDTLKKIENKIKLEYPNISVSTFSPPFKDNFTDEENQEIIDKINNFKPDVLFIGMTAPKQEKWLIKNKNLLEFKIASAIGAVFDFYVGNVKRPHKLFEKFHIEWLGRLINEPKRLWRRNLSVPLFLKDLFVEKILGE